jgi:hypothetical protein
MKTLLPSISIQQTHSRALLFGAVALLLGSTDVSAQIFSKTQNFSGSAPTSSTYITNTTAAAATNSGSAGFFTSGFTRPGFGAFGSQDDNSSDSPNTIPVTFETQAFEQNSTNNVLTFQLGQRDTGGAGRGFSNDNRVEVSISLNDVVSRVLTIVGPTTSGSASGPSFDIGTGNEITTSSATPQTVPMSTTGIGRYRINLPNFAVRTFVRVTISITAARRSTVLIDNVTISSSNPLPVELTSFEAQAKSLGVNLNWATATEKNNDRFEVQRSANGETFQTIGTVKGQGNSSSARSYSFTDSRPLAGLAYYRLRQVDTDGKASFSPVINATWMDEKAFAVYPNPSAGFITLPGTLGAVQYRVFNVVGQTVLSGQAAGNDRLDFTTLKKGTFFLELTSEAGRSTQRLVRE